MSSTAKLFTVNIPQYTQDPNNGQDHLIADMEVEAVAYINSDGSVKGIDIEVLTWKGTNVTFYVYECQPETWDKIKEAARAYFTALPPCHPSKKNT
jgi:hypothetical protein